MRALWKAPDSVSMKSMDLSAIATQNMHHSIALLYFVDTAHLAGWTVHS